MNTAFKIVASVAVIIAFIPGLIIEPGPLSEAAALAILASIWGLDLEG